MKFLFRLLDVKRMKATMQITMSISEWNELQEQLDNKYPSWKLSSAISKLIQHAKQSFYKF